MAAGSPNLRADEMGSVVEPWPKDVQLFQPFQAEQILLPDNADCLAVQALLRMAKLGFTVEMRPNAEHMSPTGKTPFIRVNNFVVAEFDPIVTFTGSRGVSLTEHLDSSQKADLSAFVSLVTNVLGNAELYLCWLDEVTKNEVTMLRYGCVYPWPLNIILTWQKRRQVAKKLGALGWSGKTLDEVYSEVESCCQALSERLGTQPYFFNNRPTELDALVYGHIFAIMTTRLPDDRLAEIVKPFKNLVDLCDRVDEEYFMSSRSNYSDNFERLP